ncbi:MarC family protein [Pokkaliibacter sp. MBI-7]|uniref:MarC family protein n=1 Tax=Pokkaliibacter sp. MBI-7 TaxID=3040600 RepID=UPI002449E05F|nr:MarC family protein [Pokkaliibacter sp. MBI-7]MDH2435797.1 MarC family protein [Pokkaliibacter sp. MBI-7]
MDLPTYLNALTALFVIIDPIGAALIFHSLIPADDMKHRVRMALKSTLISTLLLLIFGHYGEGLLHHLGISIHALRISGGLLLFYTAFNMITKDIEYAQQSERKDISVFPMSIPLLAGPGSLTLAILLFSRSADNAVNLGVLAAILTISFITLALMLLSRYVKTVIGRTGDEILRRFLGVILAALAIQFVYEGVKSIAGQ